jgi:hypothetical protein
MKINGWPWMAMETQNMRVIHLLPQQYMQSTENVMDRSKESLFQPLHGAQELNTWELDGTGGSAVKVMTTISLQKLACS